ncbi:iron export ABC transporter permease subunit FetB [Vulcanibacillus modesticaldus]|uniref:Iron export ABC transporter permease subunit FetB n=1 Tax=Vulcanibacillus modesticaldus TaxID=337097 RepID=A0A1D2YVF6_9BACI|nr:iron export ABC transporter permease subunit FetB [Vulcanibacillus modesticaldus]OEF99708.1 iron export ABC transporter permease subunit FetB [Vulcanibacillus modesticaldus]
MEKIIDLQVWQILTAYVFILLLLLIVKINKIPKEKEILIATTRMTLQLVITGYILVFLFENRHPLYTLLVILIMEIFAINNIFKRVKVRLSQKLRKIITFSMVIGTSISLFYFILIVINITPWYEPRYFIPLAGMIIGNSMTGITLGVTKLIDGIYSQKNVIEGALMLGAKPKMAVKQIIDSAFYSAILPSINSMVGMGIVFLPGMMTGQILSGISPLSAIEYQIAIMLGIIGSVTLSVILFVQLGYKTFFNESQQLELDYE